MLLPVDFQGLLQGDNVLAGIALLGGIGHLDLRDLGDSFHLRIIGNRGIGYLAKQLHEGGVISLASLGQLHGLLIGLHRIYCIIAVFSVHHIFVITLDFQGLLQLFHILPGGALLGVLGGFAQLGDGCDGSIFALALGGVQRLFRRGGKGDEFLHHIARLIIVFHGIEIAACPRDGHLVPLIQAAMEHTIGVGFHAEEHIVLIDGTGIAGRQGGGDHANQQDQGCQKNQSPLSHAHITSPALS